MCEGVCGCEILCGEQAKAGRQERLGGLRARIRPRVVARMHSVNVSVRSEIHNTTDEGAFHAFAGVPKSVESQQARYW